MLQRGLNRDVDFTVQPAGTSPYILNGNLTDDYGALTNEHSNGIYKEISSGRCDIIGSLSLDNKEKVLFLYFPDTNESQIIRLLNNGTIFEVTPTTTLLNFSTAYQIEATFKLNYLNQYVVYFTDDLNPPRWINASINNSVTSDNIKLFEIFASYERPHIDLVDVNNFGGLVETGVYQAFTSYVMDDGSETEWTAFSNMITVTDDPTTVASDDYDGAAAGIVTSKSITLELTNLDSSYNRIKVGILQYENGVIVADPKVFYNGTYTTDTIQVTFTNKDTVTTLSMDEILSAKAFYTKAKTINQLEGVLYMGNLEGSVDIGMQKFVNNINVNYIDTKQIGLGGNIIGSYKDPIVIFDERGFQHDEAYAFYVSFVMNNGRESKVYHLPGRAAEDTTMPTGGGPTTFPENYQLGLFTPAELVTMGNYGSTVVPECLAISGTSRFFQFFDTADNGSAITNMGYWENQNETYPDTEDWDIYTVDVSGNPVIDGTKTSLRGEKVRHHKFPFPEIFSGTSNFLSNSNKAVSTILGIRLSNICIPASVKSEVKSIKVYYARRDGTNAIVLAQTIGIPQATIDQDPSSTYNPTGNYDIVNTDIIDFLTSSRDYFTWRLTAPIFQIEDFNVKSINYLKPIGLYNLYTDPAYNYSPGPEGEFAFFADVRHANSDVTNVFDTRDSVKSLRTIQYIPNSSDRAYQDNSVQYGLVRDVYNYHVEKSVFVELTTAMFSTYSVKTLDLDNINTTYIVPSEVSYPVYNICSFSDDLYNSFEDQEIVDTGYVIDLTGFVGYIYNSPLDIYGGDTFCSYYSFRSTNELGAFLNFAFGTYTTPLSHITGFYIPVQSTVNTNMRYITDNIYSIYYPKWPLTNNTGGEPLLSTGFLELIPSSDNIFAYNTDYSKVNDLISPAIFRKQNPQENYDFKTRIIRSSKDNLEGEQDNFRSFLPNDYVDLSKNRGQIEKLSQVGDNLVIQLTNSVTKTVAREVLSLDSTNAFLGSGDIFAIPVKEILYTDIGIGGTESQWSPITTPFGLIYPDSTKGKIYNLGNTLEEISLNGMSGWALDNVRLILNETFKETTGEEFPLKDSPSDTQGIGFVAAWDDEYRRYLLTKIDYDLSDFAKGNFIGFYDSEESYENGDIVWNRDNNQFEIYANGIFFPTLIQDPQWVNLFIDKSFTIAYYPEFKCWGSFYDFKPYHYVYDNRNVYSFYRNPSTYLSDSTNMWIHNIPSSFCRFYGEGTPYNFEVDIVYNNNPNIPKTYDSVMYSTKFTQPSGNVVLTTTFDTFNMYNSYQLSGETDITNLLTARLVNTEWYINQFRNIRDSYNTPILDDDYNITGTIDLNKPFYEKERMSDKYMVARLKFENETEGRLSLQLSNPKDNPKMR